MFASLVSASKRCLREGKEFLAEQDGLGSSSRLISVACTITAIGGFVFHMYVNHALPSRDQMLGLGVLLTAGHVPYAFNQMSNRDGGA